MRTNNKTNTVRQQQIVACFISQLNNQPYETVSIGSVAHALGISKGVITYYYPKKEQLLRAVVEIIMHQYSIYLLQEGSQADGDSAEKRLRMYTRLVLGYMAKHPEQLRALQIAGQHLIDKNGTQYTQHYHAAAIRELSRILADGQKTGEFRNHDASLVAGLMLGGLNARLEVHGSSLDSSAITAVEDTFVQMVIK